MIRAVTEPEKLYALLDAAPDIYTEKIRSFADAYGVGYDFCRFYVQDGTAALCSYYGDCTAAVICDLNPDSAEELAGFLGCGQFGRVLMPYRAALSMGLADKTRKVCLMMYPHSTGVCVDIAKESPDSDISIGQVYEIAAHGFDIDLNKWYTDMSHMLRHGSARLYSLGKSACAVRMFSSSGMSYLSYVCTLPEMRGKGLAGRLLRLICSEEAGAGNDTYVFCAGELSPFYERAGFIQTDFGSDMIF